MTDYARGERLRFLREEKRLTQVEAAYESGFSDRSIRSWEHDGKIKWPHAKRYATFYGVDPESIVTRELRRPVEPEDIDDIKSQLAALTQQRGLTAQPASKGDPGEKPEDLIPPEDRPAESEDEAD